MDSLYSSEWFALNYITCPNCTGKLLPKPVEKQWVNVICSACTFGCRFVVALNDPEDSRLNVSPKELEDLLTDEKAMLQPLIVHYKWQDENLKWEKLYFFPFIAYRFLKEDQRHAVSLLPNGEMSI